MMQISELKQDSDVESKLDDELYVKDTELDDDEEEDDVLLSLRQKKKTTESKKPTESFSHDFDAALQRAKALEQQLTYQKEINDKLQKEKDDAESGRLDAERLHNNHKKRVANERKKSAVDSAQKDLDNDQLKRAVEQQKERIRKLKENSSEKSEPVVGAYKELMQHTANAYKAALNKPSVSTTAKYEFYDNGTWFGIGDSNVIAELDKLENGTATTVTYDYGGHSYQTRIADKQYVGKCCYVQKNMNPSYLTERQIRKASLSASFKSSGFDPELAKQTLFGNSIIKLSPELVDNLLNRYDFTDELSFSESLELAQLGELFSSFGSGFKYTRNDKGQTFHKSELFLKPLLLLNWLVIAKSRKYTAMRLVMHGADAAGYDGIKHDPMGFDLSKAGKNGQSWGNGTYFGLSDHAAALPTYNKEKQGTALLCLILTNEKFDGTQGSGSYTTFQLSTPISGVQNCIAIHEGYLLLILGKVTAV